MADRYCCKMMETQLTKPDCRHHTAMQCPDTPIVQLPLRSIDDKPRYGLAIKDGGNSWLHIEFCPFCGKKLKEMPRG